MKWEKTITTEILYSVTLTLPLFKGAAKEIAGQGKPGQLVDHHPLYSSTRTPGLSKMPDGCRTVYGSREEFPLWMKLPYSSAVAT